MDFYIILGIGPDASTADVKRAYRRLARRHHPGINPGDRSAEAIFERISEAYETLVDPGRRRQYDAVGGPAGARSEASSFIFAEFDFSSTKHGPQASTFSELFADVLHPLPATGHGRPEVGTDLHASLTLTFAEGLHGVERQVVVTRQVLCSACAGAGQIATPEGECRHCRGTGQIRWARGHMVFSKPCPACEGAGRQRRQRCGVCNGLGRAVRSDAVSVAVPPGTADGSRLRVVERGHAGLNGGRAGDLFVTVHVQPHPVFSQAGDDLCCVLPVAVHEAVLGARIDVPSLEGPAKLRIPPGTQAGQRLRLVGRGMANAAGSRGDLVFEVRLVLPEALDERSKELMQEFGRINGGDVRSGLSAQSFDL